MKSLLLCAGFLLHAFAMSGQEIDSLSIQTSTDWKTEGKWFGSDYIILKPLPKLDITRLDSLDIHEQAREFAKIDLQTIGEGERISFNKNQEMKYSYTLRCPVGELMRNLTEFRLKNGIIHTAYEIITWKNELHSKGKTDYEVLIWSADSITLQKIN